MIKLEEALVFAEHILSQLRPYCDRIEIAGSVRRENPEVKDLEIVCIPRHGAQKGRKSGQTAPVIGFVQTVEEWTKVSGDPWGKYTQRIVELKEKYITLDLFMANEINWGYIYAIRTGSKDFSHKVLAHNWVLKGYYGHEGNLHKKSTGEIVPVPEEEDLFKLAGIPFFEPKDRNV